MLLAVGTLLFIDSILFITKMIISSKKIENSTQGIQIFCPFPGKLQMGGCNLNRAQRFLYYYY